MSTEAKHTPLPWTRDQDGRLVDSNGRAVRFVDLALACGYVPPTDEARGNTELMFRACNAFDPKLDTLRKRAAEAIAAHIAHDPGARPYSTDVADWAAAELASR